MKDNIFNAKVGDVIYITDCSFVHRVGEDFVEDEKTTLDIDLYTKSKGKKAIVEKEPYEKTITIFGENEVEFFIDVYVEEFDLHISVVANYPSAHSHSEVEFNEAMEEARNLADGYEDFYYPEEW